MFYIPGPAGSTNEYRLAPAPLRQTTPDADRQVVAPQSESLFKPTPTWADISTSNIIVGWDGRPVLIDNDSQQVTVKVRRTGSRRRWS
jgi:hypothetical protein